MDGSLRGVDRYRKEKNMKYKNIIFIAVVFIVGIVINLFLNDFGAWRYFGTFVSAFLAGPAVSVLVGIISQFFDTGIGNIGRWILLIGHLFVGLAAGVMVMKGCAKQFWKPFIVYIVVLLIATASYYLRSTVWLMEAEGTWSVSDLMHFFLQDPKGYLMDTVKLACRYAIPMFISVYIAWLIAKITTMKYDFKYKDKY
ncbi:MAG: hypothetical protein J7K35_07870 [Syntrophobacterales bacterium]|nr:hypothetical protein [Syntrophobacterales bacterium]